MAPVPKLVVNGLTKRFGGLVAVNDVSFSLEASQILALIGPNGAGKTTLFNCLTGFHRVDGGQVEFNGVNITNWTPNQICRLGISRTFQVVQVLQGMTVLENVLVGAYLRDANTATAKGVAMEVLERVGMARRANDLAINLTLPEKKRLEVAMSLATKPEILMLDESMAGLTPTEIGESTKLIRQLRNEGLALIVVEHVMEAVMPIADNVIVLDSGIKIAEGPPVDIVKNPRVISAYLGDKYAEHVKY